MITEAGVSACRARLSAAAVRAHLREDVDLVPTDRGVRVIGVGRPLSATQACRLLAESGAAGATRMRGNWVGLVRGVPVQVEAVVRGAR